MNFFRLRVINTVLFFLLGALIGFILKDRLFPAKAKDYRRSYQPEYASSSGQLQTEPAYKPEDEDQPPRPQIEATVTPEEPEEEPAAGSDRPAPKPAASSKPQAEAVLEAEPAPKEEAAAPEVIKGDQDDFFAHPDEYAGKTLEVELQMITAKRSQRGWRLNFVYTAPDKSVDYLYADDDGGLLGDKPDLRIGYVYRVRFLCGAGRADSGNRLVSLAPTGQKAAWATGLSAVE